MGISIGGLGSYDATSAIRDAQNDQSSAASQISSGSSLTAASNPSGLSIDTGLRGQLAGLTQSSANAQTGISLLQTADGGLSQTSGLLQQIRGLALQAANGTNDASALQAIGNQVTQSLSQIDQISSSTVFGSQSLLDGSSSNLTLQTGTDASAGSTTTLSLPNSGTSALGLSGIASQIAAGGDMSAVLKALDGASSTVSSAQSDIGASANALTATVNATASAITSTAESSSSIGDADIAALSTQMAKDGIKSKFAISLLAQSNGINQKNALALLKTA